jgi:hypothetical protein
MAQERGEYRGRDREQLHHPRDDRGALYSVVVSGACGSPATSANASLTVTAIALQPQNQVVCPGSTAIFTVGATGVGLTYQWRKNGVNIAGANLYYYVTPATTAADNGALYSVVVSGACGSRTSANATLAVGLYINAQPQAQTVCLGSPATFSVGAMGGGLTYQWRKNGVNIAGATASAYTTPATTTADNGALYSVVISSYCGGQVTSSNAKLSAGVPFVVTSNANDGAGSLRAMIASACPGSAISFAGGFNLITLNSPIVISKNVTIKGPVSAQLTISGNNVTQVFQINSGISATLSGLTIANGRATGNGGAIDNRGTLAVTNSTFSGNSATGDGGGIANSGSVSLVNSTLSGNSATGNGGGVANLNTGTMTLVNNTLSGNRAGIGGGGLFNSGGNVFFKNTIIAGSQAQDVFGAGPVYSLGGNLIGSNVSIVQGPGDQFNVNPLLAPLGNYGGPTQTHALLPGSPAINRGDKCVLTNSCGANIELILTTDQRGVGRQMGGYVDIGAFESGGFTLAIAGGNNQSTTINTSFANPLAVKVTALISIEPVSGGQVIFAQNGGSGQGATIAGVPATVNADGVAATGTVTANGVSGPYFVPAGWIGGTIVYFSLTNTAPLLATQVNAALTTTSASDVNDRPGRKIKVARAVGDYDGDGKSDLAVWRAEEGQWKILYSASGETQTVKLGDASSPEDTPVSGDFDGDGKADIAVFRRGGSGAGHWVIKRSSDGEVTDVAWGSGQDVPVAADYDGDGKTDLAVWRGAESTWRILRSSDNQEQIVSWGTSLAPFRDAPVPADYDGDGKADIAVFRQANGHWYIRQSSDGLVIDKAWGAPADLPVASDYDGDGKADLAVWRGAEGAWYVLRSGDGGMEVVSWGASGSGDMPVPGDYDGDGKADVAFWRSSEGVWYVKSSADASTITKTQGQWGDRPVNVRQQ